MGKGVCVVVPGLEGGGLIERGWGRGCEGCERVGLMTPCRPACLQEYELEFVKMSFCIVAVA